MTWLWVFFICSRCSLLSAQWNLYETDRSNPFAFDCLPYYVRGGRLLNDIHQKIDYCRRPDDPLDEPTQSSDQRFTFNELHRLKITPHELLLWSAPVDLVEHFATYTSQPTNANLSSLQFVNCTPPWFGPTCQYSFELGASTSLAEIVGTTFEEKSNQNRSRHSLTNSTCYRFLECNRGPPMCLDWREICNGRIDCIDSGADEAHCWPLETNACAPDEYRCHNGLCIPRDFLYDDRDNPDCLDRSDESVSFNTFDSCFKDPTFRCEEHTCHPNFGLFPCGDGQCESPFHVCKNHRHFLLEEATLTRGNLALECWMVMACLTGFNPTVNGHSCNQLYDSSVNITAAIAKCPPLFQFPVYSVVPGGVRFLFFNNRSDGRMKQVLQPDLICYDAQLCETPPATIDDGTWRCRRRTQITSEETSNYAAIVRNVTAYFRRCSVTYTPANRSHPALYCCTNSSKCIAKSRLLDNVRDCPMGDDEIFNGSCAMNASDRFRCNEEEERCYAPIVDRAICHGKRKQNESQLVFQAFCNGTNDGLRQEIDGLVHTDETDCEHWPCSNMYTRCDDRRTCPQGEDEWNCVPSDCPLGFHPCLSPVNYSLTCVPQASVGDGKIDCLGASDEGHLCAVRDSNTRSRYRFRCWNVSQCVSAFLLCDNQRACPSRDDEVFCANRRHICPKVPLANRSKTDETICQLFSRVIDRRIYFTLSDGMESASVGAKDPPMSPAVSDGMRPKDPAWMWRCNRGLYARFRTEATNESYRCFCPPSYYGEFCQFQSQRISLTLGILAPERHRLYSILVRLVDDEGTTFAHEQFSFMGIWGCNRPFNVYLLYPTRPKDMSRNYSVRIDAFDKSPLGHIASWHLPIPLAFLPVNRLASQLTLPVHVSPIVPDCPLSCKNGGQCRRHVDTERFFCHCSTNWTGHQCKQPASCATCSPDSLCVGSICICPPNRFGPRCSLSGFCPRDHCLNAGQCVLIDESVINHNFICICTEPYYGARCELAKRAVRIPLVKSESTSYVLAHAITVSNESQPISAVTLKKFMRHQSSVTFYLREPVHLLFVQISADYYLVNVSTLSPCPFVSQLAPPAMPRIQLIKHYHRLCHNHSDLACFLDGHYMCLCTSERHANCFEFDAQPVLTCRHHDYCRNGGTCYQDHHTCPSATVCLCTGCHYGAQCQFVAESFGITFDDILRYEFRRLASFSQQRRSVTVSALLTGLIFLSGLVSSVLSHLTFRREKVRQVGCGVYLHAASVYSFLTVLTLVVKFWFVTGTQLELLSHRAGLRVGCVIIEPVLKAVYYTDQWLKACVAIERAVSAYRGVYFNKAKSIRIARWLIVALPLLIIGTIVHEPIHRHLSDDEEGHHRHWCVVHYSSALRKYDSMIVIVHFVLPFLINLSSALFLMISMARQRMVRRHQDNYRAHLREQFNEHKHTLISSVILIVLLLPRLVISLASRCIKSSDDPWLYLLTYLISFAPAGLTFAVFVLPSDLYRTEFTNRFRAVLETSATRSCQ